MRHALAQFMLVVFVAIPVFAAQRGSGSSNHTRTQPAPVQRNASRANVGNTGARTTGTTTNRRVVVNRYYNNNGFSYGYGGYYYPGTWYSTNAWGVRYQVGFAPHISMPGIKFDLDQVSSKKDRELVENADVYLPSEAGANGNLGRVKNFSGNFHKALPLRPGTYDLDVALADGREIMMSVTVQPQRITHVALRLDGSEKPEKEKPADTK